MPWWLFIAVVAVASWLAFGFGLGLAMRGVLFVMGAGG